MVPSESAYITISASSSAPADAVAAALPAWGLSQAARARVSARLALRVTPDSPSGGAPLPCVWWSFTEEGRAFLARGVFETPDRLFIHLRMWPETAGDPGALLGVDTAFRSAPPSPGEGDILIGDPVPAFASTVETYPRPAAGLLAGLYAVSLLDSTLVIALPAAGRTTAGHVPAVVAFARAALPEPLKARCAVTLPLGSPRTLVAELGTRVVAFDERDTRLVEAHELAQERGGGVLFEPSVGVSSGPMEQVAACQAYAEAAVEIARRGAAAVLRLSHKAGLLGEAALNDPAGLPLETLRGVTLAAEDPRLWTELLRGWMASGDPDRYQALLEAGDWQAVDEATVAEAAAATAAPLGGSRLQAAALRELGRRPGGAARLLDRLRAASPADPAAVAHAARLARAGLLAEGLPAEWITPVAEALDGDALREALQRALEKGPAAKSLSLALLGRFQARSGLDADMAALLEQARDARQLNDLDVALAAERAYDAVARNSLKALSRALDAAGDSLTAEQRLKVLRTVLSAEAAAVSPTLIFDENGGLRPGRAWVDEIALVYEQIPAGARKDLSSRELAALWAAAKDRPPTAQRLIAVLDAKMARSPVELAAALAERRSWLHWQERSEASPDVRAAAALAWLRVRHSRAVYLEEWKAALADLPPLDADALDNLLSARANRGLFDPIPYFEPEQLADLIGKAPDQRTMKRWNELLDSAPELDPYRSPGKRAEEYLRPDPGAAPADGSAAAGSSGRQGPRKLALRAVGSGDLSAAEAHWPELRTMSSRELLAAEALGALLEGRLDAPCWSRLAETESDPLAPLLELIRRRLKLEDLVGMSAPLLELLRHRRRLLAHVGRRVPALELLTALSSRSVVILPAMQIARIAAESEFASRSEWWEALAARAPDCPRPDGPPHPAENWAHVHACLYFQAAGLPGEAADRFRKRWPRRAAA